MLKIAIPWFLPFFDENHIKRQVDGEKTVLILLFLEPMTKTSQLNEIAIMIYDGGCPVLKKYQFLVFRHYFDENHMKEIKMKKGNCIIIETNDKNKSTKWKIQGRCFQTRTQSQIAF